MEQPTNHIIANEPRRILSFDIGIKNLAFCYLDENTPPSPPKSYRILDWKVLDLMQPPRSRPIIDLFDLMGDGGKKTCTCCLGGGKPKKRGAVTEESNQICGKKAKYQWGTESPEYYCETHAKTKKDRIIPKKQHETSWLNKQSKETLGQIYEKAFTDTFWKKYTKKFLVEKMTKYYQERCFQIIREEGFKTSKEMDLITIGKHMAQHLDKIFLGEDATAAPTHIIIENQISTIASRMKTIQGELTMYFLLRFPESHIEYISSKNKLKDFVEESTEEVATETRETESTKYKKHKTDAVKITKRILLEKEGEGGSWNQYFLNEKKKKDDLADCFLQGLWYINHK